MGALTKDRIKLFDRSLFKFYHVFFVCRLVSSHSWIMLTVTVLKSCRIFNYAIFAFFFHILIQVRTFIVYILHCSERILPYSFTKLIFSLRRIEIIRDLINYSKLLCCEDTLLKIAFQTHKLIIIPLFFQISLQLALDRPFYFNCCFSKSQLFKRDRSPLHRTWVIY